MSKSLLERSEMVASRKAQKPLVFKLFKTHHERDAAEAYADRIWRDRGGYRNPMQV